MRKSAKKVLAVLFSVLGSVLGLYVGGYLLFARSVYNLVTGFTSGTLTSQTLIISIIEIFIASTVSGAIWCICDIIAGYFRDVPKDD